MKPMEENTLNIDLKKVEKVFHIADTHIRNLNRHTEYRAVFQTLYKHIKRRKTKNSLIYLGGDIVHSKLDMSPELISMTYDFLGELTELAPTIMICGNHDTALNNRNRMDVLTPIVNMLDSPNLFYLKTSGLYHIADVSFVVMSIFDDPSTYISADDFEADTNN